MRAIAAAVAEGRRVQDHDAGLHIAGFYPSLHLNLADNYRRLGSFTAATDHIARAERHSAGLPDDPYGDMIRTAISQVAAAITHKDTVRRPSAPGPWS